LVSGQVTEGNINIIIAANAFLWENFALNTIYAFEVF
jgi:hypothetical protein